VAAPIIFPGVRTGYQQGPLEKFLVRCGQLLEEDLAGQAFYFDAATRTTRRGCLHPQPGHYLSKNPFAISDNL
jgi:hypothetical protein